MAVDTRNKRISSSLGLRELPSSDGSIDSEDIRTMLGLYSFGAGGVTPPPTPTPISDVVYTTPGIVDENVRAARRDALKMFKDNILVKRYSKGTSSPVGGRKRTLLSSRNIRGLLQTDRTQSLEGQRGDTVASTTRFTISTKWDEDVTTLDEIVIGNYLYQVVDTNKGETNRITLKIYLLRVT